MRRVGTVAALVVGYLALAVVLTWPLIFELNTGVAGIHNVDSIDTAWLRLLVARGVLHPGSYAHSTELLYPAGYPLGALLPNTLDHLTAAPLTALLPWPLADNLWWLGMLAANGLAGHVLGYQLAGHHRGGVVAGVAFACCEPVLREANFGHAPQAMVCFAPLFLAALLRTVAADSRPWHGVAAGVLLALSALTYWYQAMFFGVVSLPVVVWGVVRAHREGRLRTVLVHLGVGAVASWLVIALPLAVLLTSWSDLPQTGAGVLPDFHLSEHTSALAEDHRWAFAQSGDVLWWLRPTPLDRSNRLALPLLGAAIAGGFATPRGSRWPWVVGAVLGGVMLMGPYLKIGEEPVLILGWPIPLPWRFLAGVSDTLERFHWPQRWGAAVPLMLLPLAARVRWPLAWAGALVVECLVLSGNAPLHVGPVQHLSGWRNLAGADGAILVLPLERRGVRAPQLGWIYRATGRPLAADIELPPGTPPKDAWEAWLRDTPFTAWLDERRQPGASWSDLPEGALDDLRAQGFSAIAIDATPGGILGDERRENLVRRATLALGRPRDYGSAIVWWLDPSSPTPAPLADPDAWRADTKRYLDVHTEPAYRMMLVPVRVNPQR